MSQFMYTALIPHAHLKTVTKFKTAVSPNCIVLYFDWWYYMKKNKLKLIMHSSIHSTELITHTEASNSSPISSCSMPVGQPQAPYSHTILCHWTILLLLLHEFDHLQAAKVTLKIYRITESWRCLQFMNQTLKKQTSLRDSSLSFFVI